MFPLVLPHGRLGRGLIQLRHLLRHLCDALWRHGTVSLVCIAHRHCWGLSGSVFWGLVGCGSTGRKTSEVEAFGLDNYNVAFIRGLGDGNRQRLRAFLPDDAVITAADCECGPSESWSGCEG